MFEIKVTKNTFEHDEDVYMTKLDAFRYIVFEYMNNDFINENHIVLYSDGKLKADGLTKCSDPEVVDEVNMILSENDKLLNKLYHKSGNKIIPFETIVKFGNYTFYGNYFKTNYIENRKNDSDKAALRDIYERVKNIILKYTDSEWDWSTKDSILSSEEITKMIENTKKKDYERIDIKKIYSPVLFRYFPGQINGTSEIVLYEDGTLTRFIRNGEEKFFKVFLETNSSKVEVILKNEKLAERVKSIVRKSFNKIKKIPSDFTITLPYKSLLQSVRIMDKEFVADRLMFPVSEQTQLKGITRKRLKMLQKVFFKIITVINEETDEDLWDMNLYLNHGNKFKI